MPRRDSAVLLHFILAATATFTLAADPKDCGPEPPLPISRGQDEIRAAVTDVMNYVDATPLTAERFKALARPYAPLDLEVRGRHTAQEASSVKNFFFGVVGTAAGLDRQAILGLSLGVLARYGETAVRSGWTEHLEAQRLLAERFHRLDASVLAQWGENEYRVNDWFKLREGAWMSRSSTELGLCPWGGATSTLDDLVPNLVLPDSQRSAAQAILTEMTRLGIVAIVRQPSGAIRIIQDGVADNEIGTLFISPSAPQPRQGDELSDGKSIELLQPLGDGAFYYFAG